MTKLDWPHKNVADAIDAERGPGYWVDDYRNIQYVEEEEIYQATSVAVASNLNERLFIPAGSFDTRKDKADNYCPNDSWWTHRGYLLPPARKVPLMKRG